MILALFHMAIMRTVGTGNGPDDVASSVSVMFIS